MTNFYCLINCQLNSYRLISSIDFHAKIEFWILPKVILPLPLNNEKKFRYLWEIDPYFMYHATASTRVKGIDREKRKRNCQKTAVGYIFATINCYIAHSADFCCSLTVCHLVSQNQSIFFTFFCFIQLKVCFGFWNWQLLEPCVAID